MKTKSAKESSDEDDDSEEEVPPSRRATPALVCPITNLVDLPFSQTVVPSAWKVAAVTPIFKSGGKTDKAI